MVSDHYVDKWRAKPGWEDIGRLPIVPFTIPNPNDSTYPSQDETIKEFIRNHQPIARKEFDELKRDVQELKELLKRAKVYDEKTNQPDCEMQSKIDILRKVAALVGVNLDDVIGEKQ